MELTREQVGRAVLAGACDNVGPDLVGRALRTLTSGDLGWAEAQGIVLGEEFDVAWAEAVRAAGLNVRFFGHLPLRWLSGSGYGSGSGDGYGSGYGSGDGSGFGYGYGSGDGYGYGYGDGYGYGSGSGSGDG